ncbi:hypothetical protein M3J09_006699 [Ascochyta lentis]
MVPCLTQHTSSTRSSYAPDSRRLALVPCPLQPQQSVGPPRLIDQILYDVLGLFSDRHEKADTTSLCFSSPDSLGHSLV